MNKIKSKKVNRRYEEKYCTSSTRRTKLDVKGTTKCRYNHKERRIEASVLSNKTKCVFMKIILL